MKTSNWLAPRRAQERTGTEETPRTPIKEKILRFFHPSGVEVISREGFARYYRRRIRAPPEVEPACPLDDSPYVGSKPPFT